MVYNFRQMKKILFLSFLIFSIFGCSLKYDEEAVSKDVTPEFIFENPSLVRVENGKKSVIVNAEKIEKYKSNSIFYASDVLFETFDRYDESDAKGSCGLLYADLDSQVFELFDGISLYSKEYDTTFHANVLKWDGKTEQLIGSKRDTVRVEKNDTIIFGTGFSASGISRTFHFNGTVTGEIESE